MNLFKIALSFSGFSIPLVTELLILIDAGIYAIVTATIKGFYDILQVSYTIFGESNGEGLQLVSALVQRVMMLSGIYALFKVSLMLINYIIDPSKLKSAEKTGFDIAKNIFIAIVLLATSRFIFQKLGEFQKLVFESNVIENIIYGNDGVDAKDEIIGDKNAEKLSNNMWLMFFTAKTGAPANSECSAKYANVSSGEAGILSLIGCHYKYYDYLPVAPFIVGVLLIYYFLIYCIELASRMLKLLILEMISPIPIIMSIDPNQKNKLSNFIKTYIPIYLQIFVRVLTFYGAFAVGSLVIGSAETIAKDSTNVNWFLKILIIIGVFQGMKELPKLIEDALGFKISGGNSEKTFGGYVRGLLGAGAGIVGGGVAGAVSGGFGGALAGAVSGGFNAMTGAAGAKNAGAVIKSTVASIGGAGALGNTVSRAGGLFPFIGGSVSNMFGGQKRDAKTLGTFDKQVKDADTGIENINRAAELREKLNETVREQFAKTNGSLEERLNGDEMLNRWKFNLRHADSPETEQMWNEQINKRTAQMTNHYNSQVNEYFDEQVKQASSGGNNLAEDTRVIKRALDSYNGYTKDAGLENREIKGHTDIERLRNADLVDIDKFSEQSRQAKDQKREFENDPKRVARRVTAESKGKKPGGR